MKLINTVQHCHLDGSEASQAKTSLPFSKKDKEKVKWIASVSIQQLSEDLHSPTRGILFMYLNMNNEKVYKLPFKHNMCYFSIIYFQHMYRSKTGHNHQC